ncbi:MAG: histidine phosphatase family protein [Butyrivibrio sp.]|nr:histidine phosphatase family protein [Butyrivibrio sp.]
MKLLFIRHGDPDYEKDALTEKGKKEAMLLSNMIDTFGIDDVYQSPLGRAKETASYSLLRLGKEAVTYEWLKEFPAVFDPNLSESARQAYENELVFNKETGKYDGRILWDVLPSYYAQHQDIFDPVKWRESEIVKCSNMVPIYDEVVSEFEKLLADYGYVRDGRIFRVKEGNDKVIAFFCHFGITCVLLSYLWQISPFTLFQYLAAAPTSVTEVVSEERQKGIAIFRTLRIGDITHLTMGQAMPSFSARFCEKYENEDERH